MFSYEAFPQFPKSYTEQDFYNANVYSRLQHSFQFSAGKDLQWRQRIPYPAFPWTPSDTRGDNGATEKNIIKGRSVPLFKPIATLCFAISLGVTERATFCSHPDYFTPSALECKLLLAHMSALTVPNYNPGSYEQPCSRTRTREVTAEWRWPPPLSVWLLLILVTS